MSLRSPLGRVLGLGSAKEGTDHFWTQRVSAVGLAILGLWFLVGLAGMDDWSRAAFVATLSGPLNSVLLVLLTLTLAWHSWLGVQVVIEDYVHGPFLKVISLIAVKFAHVVAATVAVFAILKIAFGGAA